MAAGRLMVGLGLLAGGGIFLAQNGSRSLPLVFLGQPTIGLPLGVWVILAGLAGAGTTVLLTALFRWSNYLTRQATKRAMRFSPDDAERFSTSDAARTQGGERASPPPPPRDTAGETVAEPWRWPWSASSASPSPATSPSPAATSPTTSASGSAEVWDDWTEDQGDRDWEDRPPQASPTTSRISTPEPDPKDARRPENRGDEPAASRPSSVYSYSAQSRRNAAVGRSEAVYDAEYRVLIPPYRDLSEAAIADEYGDEQDYGDDPADQPMADEYDETDTDLGEDDFEDEDEDEVLGDEVFDDWETEAEDDDWSRR